jgi:hypothetical protein
MTIEQPTTPTAPVSEYEYESYPLVKRIVALAADVHPSEVDSTDGSYQDVEGLLAERDYAASLAIAETLGLTGDWETDDVTEAITEALHEYRELRAEVARLRTATRQVGELADEWARFGLKGPAQRLRHILDEAPVSPDPSP